MARAPAEDGATRSKRHPEQVQLEAAFSELDLDDSQRANLCRRYLDYVDWLEAAATRSRRAYYALRLIAVITAAIVPALVAANISGTARVVAVVLGVVLAATTATEAFLHLGDRWRHYRLVVELLKAQSWLFVQHSGPYAGTTPKQALGAFVERMEGLIHDEVRDYVSTVVADRGSEDTGKPPPAPVPDAAVGFAAPTTGRGGDGG